MIYIILLCRTHVNLYPLMLREPDIKITFFTRTKFGTIIYFRPYASGNERPLNPELSLR